MVDRPSDRAAAPEAVAYVRDLLRDLDAGWFLCRGWAVDAWLGRQTREHGDVDIAVPHHRQYPIFEHLSGWAMVGHDPNVADDTSEPWNGRHLDPPAHIHVPRPGSPLATSPAATHSAVEFEFLLVEGSDHELILNRDRSVSVPLERGVWQSPWGLPVAAPEIVLFFKAGGDLPTAELRARNNVFRRRDEEDLSALLPTLGAARRGWLREALGRVLPEHAWLAHLES